MADDNRKAPGAPGDSSGKQAAKGGKADPRSRLTGRIPPPPPPPRGGLPPAGKGVRPAPLAPRKPMPGKAAAGSAPGSVRMPPPPPPPPLRSGTGKPAPTTAGKPSAAGGLERAKPKTGLFPTAPGKDATGAGTGKTATGETADNEPTLKDFAARLRAQREAAERLLSRRGKSGSGQETRGTPSTDGKSSGVVAGAGGGASASARGAATEATAFTPEMRGGATGAPAETVAAGGEKPLSAVPSGVSGVAAEPAAPAPERVAEMPLQEAEAPAIADAHGQGAPAEAGPQTMPAGAPPEDAGAQMPPARKDDHAGTETRAPVDELFEEISPPRRTTDEYADVYAELEQMEEAPRHGTPWLPLVLAFFLIAAAAAAAVYFFLRSGGFSGAGGGADTGNVPVIEGPQNPAKVTPPEAATAPKKPHGRKLIYDRITDEEDKATATPPAAPERKPAGSAPEPVAPPPLPPPPSLGDDQGKARPSQPAPGASPPAEGVAEERTAALQAPPLPPPPVDISPTGGGKAATDDGEQARRAAQSELTAAIRRFASLPETPVAKDRSATAETGMTTAGLATAAPRTAKKKVKAAATPSGSDTKTANTGDKPSAIKPAPKPAPRRIAATQRRNSGANTAGAGAKTRREAARSQPGRRPRTAKATDIRVAAARPTQPAPRPAAGRSGGGPIPLPGAAPATGAPVVAATPAPPAAVPPAPRAATAHKRTNFKSVKILGARRAATTAPSARPAPAAQPRREERRVAALATAPRNVARPAAPAPQAAGKGYVVQLAAFRSQQDAARAWQRIRAKHGGLLGGMQPIISKANLGDAGTFYRLSIGTLPSRQAASRICQRLIARGEPDCLIRKR